MEKGSGLLDEIVVTLSELQNSGKLKELVNKALSQNISAVEIIEKGLRIGIDRVGEKYERCEYFLAELLFANTLMSDALEVLEPHLRRERPEGKGVIVLGTVRGDVHDIGKNVFKTLAQAEGFEVHDLGVDVEPEAFLNKIKETDAKVLGLSTLLTTTLQEMKNVMDLLASSGVRGNVKVLIGGNAVTKDFAEEIGADGAALNAVEGVNACRRWLEN
jgi:methylmalonyl-CoA mutase cobalamin-binding domain/chain